MTRHQFVPDPTPRRCVLAHQRDPDRARTASRGHLCEGHYLRLEQHLAETTHLCDSVEAGLTRYSNGLTPKVSGTKEQPLPYLVDSEGDSRALLALRGIRDTLASWTRLVLEEHPSGLHTPTFTVPALSAFLGIHLEWIVEQDWVDDLVDELGDARHALRAAQRTASTRIVPVGTCGQPLTCDVHTHAETCCDGTLRAFVSTIDDNTDARPIVCSACGTEHQPADWRPLARRLRGDTDGWLTAEQLSSLWHVAVGTVWRWASEDDWRRIDRRPKRYHHDDAQASYERRRLEETA